MAFRVGVKCQGTFVVCRMQRNEEYMLQGIFRFAII